MEATNGIAHDGNENPTVNYQDSVRPLGFNTNMMVGRSLPDMLGKVRARATSNSDNYAWLLEQARALQSKDSASIDWDGLAEELEAMAAKDRRDVVSQLRNLLASLLKWKYSAVFRSDKSWKVTILRTRQEVGDIFEDSAALKNQLPDFLSKAFRQARSVAGTEMQLEKHQWEQLFEQECPWTAEEVLSEDFLPSIASNANGRTR